MLSLIFLPFYTQKNTSSKEGEITYKITLTKNSEKAIKKAPEETWIPASIVKEIAEMMFSTNTNAKPAINFKKDKTIYFSD